MSDRELGVALICFDGEKRAAKARKAFEAKLRANGDDVLQTTIVEVNKKRKASVRDARRVLAGTLTAALTWGLFGLVAGTNKVESTIVWAVVGAVCGGAYAYLLEHVLTKAELRGIGQTIAPDSSALLTYIETSDPALLLAAAEEHKPAVASAAVVDDDLTAHVRGGLAASPSEGTVLSMVLYRYPDPKLAARVAHQLSKAKHADGVPQVELVIETAANGRRHVIDPTRGTAAWARSDVVSWGLFGVVVGALAGAIGGGGLHGLVDGAVVTGIGWAVFGLFAGALYGLWAGRSISARRLKGIGAVLGKGTSAVLAWIDGPGSPQALEALARPDARRLVLNFNPTHGGAVLEAK